MEMSSDLGQNDGESQNGHKAVTGAFKRNSGIMLLIH
jgi:hypothetical protein